MRAIKIASVFFLLFLVNSANSQWTQTSGPNSSVIQYMATAGTNIYTTSYYDGIYLSTNSGLNWMSINSGIPSQLHLYNAAAFGNNVFVYAEDTINGTQRGVYRSTNMGTNWSLNLSISPFDVIGSILINNGRVMCGASYSSGGGFVFLSSNNGLSWDSIYIPSSSISPLAANGNNIYALGSRMYLSTDNGSSWTPLPASPTNIHAIAVRNSTIYAGNWDNITPIHKSTDNGATWFPAYSGIPVNRRITSLLVIGNDVYASTYVLNDAIGGIYKSTDDGNSWMQSGLATMWVDNIKVIGNNLYACTAHGIFLSTDSGLNWTNSSNGFPFLTVDEICYNGNRTFAGTKTGLYYTTNEGDNWIVSTYPYGGILAVFSNNNKMVVADYKNARYSFDNGQNWSILIGLPAGVPRISTVASTASTFLVDEYTTNNPNSGTVLVTSNNGVNWTSTAQPTARLFVNSGSNVFSATNAGVFLSTDGGFNWTSVNSGLTSTNILSIVANGNFIVAGTNGNGPFLSTNNGSSWVAINSGISSAVVYSLALKGNTIFAGTNLQSNKMFMSINNGASWIAIDGNLTNFSVNALSVDSNYLYAATGIPPGVWRRALSGLTGIQSTQNHIPDKFSLSQNYPNPFNPTTKIGYDLPVSGFVKLEIFDINGRVVKTLIDRRQNAGRYQIEFDASNYTSGVYFYKIVTDDFTKSRKMVLIK